MANKSVFFSYARQNKEVAIELAKQLKSAGVNLWVDQLDIPAGTRWDREIEKALEACDFFTLCCISGIHFI